MDILLAYPALGRLHIDSECSFGPQRGLSLVVGHPNLSIAFVYSFCAFLVPVSILQLLSISEPALITLGT